MTKISNPPLEQVEQRLKSANQGPDFLDAVFGSLKRDILAHTPVILFGAGSLGKEMFFTLQTHGVQPSYFCDNNPEKIGTHYCGIPVIGFEELLKQHKTAVVVISSHKNHSAISDQLLSSELNPERIVCKASDPLSQLVFMYSMVGTQSLLSDYKRQCEPLSILDYLKENDKSLSNAYDLLADQHSRELFLSKLALIASGGNFRLFTDFIVSYSQPILKYGLRYYDGTPEDYFYFNNDVFSLASGETYIDVGAYDGDTVLSFIHTCERHKLTYRWIHAYEPDLYCFQKLLIHTAPYDRLSCYPLGLWSHSGVLRFRSSANALHDQAGSIDSFGDTEVQVVALDDHLKREKVTMIKMDPSGDVIPQALLGSARIISQHQPKLAIGAYHSVRSIFEIPLIINRICPKYEFFLRHNTYHLCDTDLLARPKSST